MKKSKIISLIAGAMAFTTVAGTLVGCGSDSSDANTSTASSDQNQQASVGEKEITIAIYRDGDMDELDAATYNGPHVIYKMLYEGFAEDGGVDGIIPMLATSWDISKDNKTYTFHLREGVTFTDGTPFNAEAVCFNLARWVNNDRHASLTSYAVDSYQALDEYTVEVKFKEGAYPILTELTYPRPVRFLSPSSIQEDNENKVMGKFTSPIGTGQWKLESYTKDEEFTLVPNENYWGEKPQLDRIRFKVITDGQARVMALESGEVDVIGGDLLGKISTEGLQELKSKGYKIMEMDTMCAYYLNFSQDNEAFQDVRVRQAVNYAIDKDSMVKDLLYGVGQGAKGLYNAEITPYVTEENSPGYTYDLEKAKSLMESAGYQDTNGDGIVEKDGKPLNIRLVLTTDEFPEWKTMAEYVQSQLLNIGIKVELQTLDTNAYTECQMTTLDYDMIMQRTSSDSWVPHGDMKIMFSQLSVANGHARVWYDEGLLKNINEAMVSNNETDRQAAYDKVFKQINDEALLVPLYYPTTTFAVSDKVSNFEVGVNNYAPINWTTLDVK